MDINAGALVAIGNSERHVRKASHCGNNRVHMPWSLYYCLFAPYIYMGVVLRTYPVRGESHIQRNASGEVATIFRFSDARWPWTISALIEAQDTVVSEQSNRNLDFRLKYGLLQCKLKTIVCFVQLYHYISIGEASRKWYISWIVWHVQKRFRSPDLHKPGLWNRKPNSRLRLNISLPGNAFQKPVAFRKNQLNASSF